MTLNAGDVVTVDFPGVMGVKRRPAPRLASSGFTSCVYFSEFHCDVAALSQFDLYWAVIRTRLERRSGLC